MLPAFNEAGSLLALVDEVVAAAPSAGFAPLTVVVVDDGSRDGTWDAVVAAHARHPAVVRGVRLRVNCGKSAALAAGLDAARTALVGTLDADGQDDPAAFAGLRVALDAGADLVTGRKADRRDRWSRRAASRAFNAAVRAVAGVPVRDVNSGLKLMRAEVAAEVAARLRNEWHRLIPVLAHLRGFRVAEVDVPHRPRRFGRSKFGRERIARGVFDLLTLVATARYGRRPGHLFGWLGVAFGGLGAAALTYLAIRWALGDRPIGTRPLLAYGAVLLTLGVQCLSLGFLAELVAGAARDGAAGPPPVRETIPPAPSP